MTDKEFCKLDTAFYGEEVDHIKQIALRTFNGEELKEYVEHCIKLHLLNIPDVIDMLVCNYCLEKAEKLPDGVGCENCIRDYK